MSVVRRAIFHISSIDGGPLGVIFVELSGGESGNRWSMPLSSSSETSCHLTKLVRRIYYVFTSRLHLRSFNTMHHEGISFPTLTLIVVRAWRYSDGVEMIPEFILKTLPFFRLDSFVTFCSFFIEPYVTQITTRAEHALAADSN